MSKARSRPKFYRALEILPGLATWTTLIGGLVLSYFQPVWVAIFIIIFDLYFFFMALNILFHLLHTYKTLQLHKAQNWLNRCEALSDTEKLLEQLKAEKKQTKERANANFLDVEIKRLARLTSRENSVDYKKIHHVVLLPMVTEPYEMIKSSVDSYYQSNFPKENVILALAVEQRGGEETRKKRGKGRV